MTVNKAVKKQLVQEQIWLFLSDIRENSVQLSHVLENLIAGAMRLAGICFLSIVHENQYTM